MYLGHSQMLALLLFAIYIAYVAYLLFKKNKQYRQEVADLKQAQEDWAHEVNAYQDVYMEPVKGTKNTYQALYRQAGPSGYTYVQLEYDPKTKTFAEINTEEVSDEASILLTQNMALVAQV